MQLATAEEHVALGALHIARQKQIIAEFEACGRDSTSARELLATFEDSQGMHIADRDRLRKELADSAPP